jgi:hypothetical protein
VVAPRRRVQLNGSNRPVFDLQFTDLAEGAVIGHQHSAGVRRMGRDQQVERRERLPAALHVRPHVAIALRDIVIPRRHIDAPQKLPGRAVESGRLARPNSSSPAVIADMHNDAIEAATTHPTTAGCCLIRCPTMFVSRI